MMYIKTFEQITQEDVTLVGGKGATLGTMSKEGIPIPAGFVVTTSAYNDFFDKPLPQNVVDEMKRLE